ncbi:MULTISPECIES: hypothetical protein [unclassified Saccharicrinis]|uniref:hypothetical protein n=1 Tax=unclassified Saccharicrinis TaxID=2646859 RepID=UPI003D347C66
MIKEKARTETNLEDKIISFVSEKQPVHIGEIFKTLRISQTKGMNYVTSMINQGKLIYASHNQVNAF